MMMWCSRGFWAFFPLFTNFAWLVQEAHLVVISKPLLGQTDWTEEEHGNDGLELPKNEWKILHCDLCK